MKSRSVLPFATASKTWSSFSAKWTDKDRHERDWFDHAFDAIVVQKFLPKLHGSKVKLGLLLKKLYTASVRPANAGSRMLEDLVEPSPDIPGDARYRLTAEKISRLWRQLEVNGFTSFGEN
jgi:5-methylcytosine-specific restriction enzyme B